MQSVQNVDDMQSQIVEKHYHSRILQGNNTSDDFLVGSGVLLKSNHDHINIKQLQNKIVLMQRSKALMKNVFEQEMFKLRQEYETLKYSFEEFVSNIKQQISNIVQCFNRSTEEPNRQLMKAVQDLRTKMQIIDMSNQTLREQNDRMVYQIQTLRTSIQQKGYSENQLNIYKIKEENGFLKFQLKEKDKKISLFQDKQNNERLKRYESTESFHLKTNPQQISFEYPSRPRSKMPSSNVSPIKQRNSDISLDPISQYKNISNFIPRRPETSLEGVTSFRRLKEQYTIQSQKPKVITRKPGVMANRPPRKSVNFEQLQTRINSIRNQLRTEIQSVQKRRIEQRL